LTVKRNVIQRMGRKNFLTSLSPLVETNGTRRSRVVNEERSPPYLKGRVYNKAHINHLHLRWLAKEAGPFAQGSHA
jgi:hypothetical protein